MKQKSRLLLIFMFVMLFCLSGVSLSAVSSINNNLLIVRSGDAPAYLAVESSFRAGISQYLEKLVSIKSLSVSDSSDRKKLDVFFSVNKQKQFDLVITVGAQATHDVLNLAPDSPVLSIFIPRQTYHAIVDQAPYAGLDVSRSSIYLDQPDERLILLSKSIARTGAKVSLFGSSDVGRALKTRTCDGVDLSYLMGNVSRYPELLSSNYLKRTLKHSDILIATAKLVKQSPNAIKWMLYMAYQRNVPVIGYSRAFVDAGAIAAVYSSPENIGRQAAEVFLLQRQQAGNKLPASVYPAYFQVSVNQNVAEALGFQHLNEDFLRKTLVESALNCRERYVPVPANGVKQQVSRR